MVKTMHPNRSETRTLRRRLGGLLTCVLFLATSIATLPGVHASHNLCEEDGKNIQCNDLGAIAMDAQHEVRGDPVQVVVEVTVDDTYTDAGARYMMFSVRHDARGGESPVSLRLDAFESAKGPIFTQRIEQDIANEVNIWAHVADIPEGETLDLRVTVGASDRGAFRLETLVMPFDRGYEPVKTSSGEDVSLFSFTLLGVNEETSTVGTSGDSWGKRFGIPGYGAAVALAAVAAAALVIKRRQLR